ncbi:hypothetical protein ACH6CV_16400 [Bacillota bacterium Meth-B3]
MGFPKGTSGNFRGRPKQTAQQKEAREEFKALLKTATVPALESIIAIAQDRRNKDRFAACRFIIEKAYGAHTAFLSDGADDASPVVIVLRPGRCDNQNEEDDWETVLEDGDFDYDEEE